VTPRSTVILTSPLHSGRSSDLDAAMEQLLQRMVRQAVGQPLARRA
jgi:hypothetical protein